MERLGVPTVTVVSSAFEVLARAEATALGLPGLPILVVSHPVSNRSPEVLRDWGERLGQESVAALTEGQAP
jgi:hypothetical protein